MKTPNVRKPWGVKTPCLTARSWKCKPRILQPQVQYDDDIDAAAEVELPDPASALTDVKTPKVKTPEGKTPEVKIPGVKTPWGVKTPGQTAESRTCKLTVLQDM